MQPLDASPWINASEAMPAPGEKVLRYYEGALGQPIGPVLSTPIHADGTHLINGESIYCKTLWWMPIPTLPTQEETNGTTRHK